MVMYTSLLLALQVRRQNCYTSHFINEKHKMKTSPYPAGIMKKLASRGVILGNLVRKQGNVFLMPFE